MMAGPTIKHKTKRQKPNNHHHQQQQQQQSIPRRWRQPNQVEKQQIIHQKKLQLSSQLRTLSSQKRLTECLQLYNSPSNDDLRDVHHGSIVVDCCARCGDVAEAEGVVIGMLLLRDAQGNQPQQRRRSNEYFWNECNQASNNYNHYKLVPIQAWTALLKAYVHSGLMSKADSLFEFLMMSSSSTGKKRKHTHDDDDSSNRNRNGPNVRTVNTLLRGCMWTAASITNFEHHGGVEEVSAKHDDDHDNKMKKPMGETNKQRQQSQPPPSSPLPALVGGVPTAQRAWSLCSTTTTKNDKPNSIQLFDTSSYEYFVTILSQSLRCKDALQYLDQMKRDFGIIGDGSSSSAVVVVDPSIMESMIVCLVAISRGYVMLGDFDQGRECANEALVVLERLQSSLQNRGDNDDAPNSVSPSSSKKVVTGGKRAWNESKNGGGDTHHNNNDGKPDGRREESNKLFRSHRLSELRSEALTLKNACSSSNRPEESIATHDATYFARQMMTRLFYFSGGGTTQTIARNNDEVVKKDDNSLTYQRWIHSLWHSFGLKETTQRAVDKDGHLQNVFQLKTKKKYGKQLPDDLISLEFCDTLRRQFVGVNCNLLSDDGCLNFDTIFQSKGEGGEAPPLHVEIGSGSGDWCVTQSKLNPNENYVSVELRADRVAQTFFKCITQNTWKNMCCVGSDCGSFLRDRVSPSQCRTIYVNHPEPPTQTYDSESSEEPAHMLNSVNLRLAANCLEGGGKGRLIIVTDNLIYARFLCRTMTRVMADGSLVGLHPSQVRDLRTVDSFLVGGSSSKVWLYEGKPSSSIGHFDAKQWARKGLGNEVDKGTSYFDRLWRTGAGKHADVKKRYIVAVCTSGGANISNFSGGQSFNKAGKMSRHGGTRNKGSTEKQKEKKPKKRSADAQKRRNERRLLKKKEQTQQQEKG
ncbi:hypothetical protein ACHAXM_003833 [Skeletonema potamos]